MLEKRQQELEARHKDYIFGKKINLKIKGIKKPEIDLNMGGIK